MKKFYLSILAILCIMPFFTYGQQCIDSLTIEQGPCNPNAVYDGMVSFSYSPNVDSVDIYFDDQYYGTHAAANQPIVLSPLVADFQSHSLLVQDAFGSTCADSLTYVAACGAAACEADIFNESLTWQCLGAQVQFYFNYTFLNPISEGHVFVNGQYVQNLPEGIDSSIVLNPVFANPGGFYEIEIRDAEYLDCSESIFIQGVNCCEIYDTEHQAVCTTDTTFNIELSFLHEGLGDQVDITDNNGIFYGTYNPYEQPILLQNLFTDISTHSLFISDIFTGCQEFYTFQSPNCAISDSCDINITNVDPGCAMGLPSFVINYNNFNASSTSKFYVNDVYLQDANQGANQTSTLNIQNLDPNGNYIILLKDELNPACADTTLVNFHFCSCDSPIEVVNVSSDCVTDSTYQLNVVFSSDSPWREFMIVSPNTQVEYGPFTGQASSFNNILASIDLPASEVGEFIIYDTQNFMCFADFISEVDCENFASCSADIHSVDFECNVEGLFFNINYSAFNFLTEGHLFLNGEYVQNVEEGADKTTFAFAFNPGSNPMDYEIVIRDAEFLSCADTFTINDLICDPCELISFGYSYDCQDDGTYTFTFENRDPQSPATVFLDSVLVGTHIEGTPDLVLEGVTANFPGIPVLVTICSEVYDCCVERTFDAPDCETNTSCEITGIQTGVLECNDDGTYDTDLFYSIENFQGDSVNVYVNNSFYGQFPYNSTAGISLTGITPRINSDYDIIKVCSAPNEECCMEYEYLQPDCGNIDCSISNFVIEFDCIGSSEFLAFVYFDYSGIEGDTVVVYDQLSNLLGYFDVREQPFVIQRPLIPGFPTQFGVVVSNPLNDQCVNESLIYDIPCLDYCEIEYVEYDNVVCNDGGFTYNAQIYYGVNSPLGQSFNVTINDLTINNVNINPNGSFILNDITPQPGSNFDVLTLCVNDFPNCCQTIDIQQPNCNVNDCVINYLEVDSIQCVTGTGTYFLTASFDIDGANNDFVDVFVNNELVSTQLIDGSIYVDGITPRPNTDYDIIKICVNDNPDCCYTIEYLSPNCGQSTDCSIRDIEVDYVCEGDELYLANVYWIAENTSGFVTLFVDGDPNGTTVNVNQQPFQLGAFFDGTAHTLKIADTEYSDCYAEIDLFYNECGPNMDTCSIAYIEMDEFECNGDGTFDMTAYYGVQNFTGSGIDVYLNNEFFGFYDFGSRVVLENIPLSLTNEVKTITICMNDNPDCCLTVIYDQPNCGTSNDCSIRALEVEYVCENDSLYFAQVYYISENTSGTVEVLLNGQSNGLYNTNQQPIVLGPYFSGSVFDIKIQDAQIQDCFDELTLFYDDCVGTIDSCSISYIETDNFECNGDGTFDMTAYYGFVNANNAFIDVFLNGEFFGFYNVGDRVVLENIPISLTTDIKTIKICINDNPDCCLTVNYDQPECNPTDDCLFDDITYSYECIGNNEYVVDLSVYPFNTSGTYDLFVNGQFNGNFPSTQNIVTLGPFQNGTGAFFKLQDPQNLNCVYEGEVFTQECFTDIDSCIVEIHAVDFVCDGGIPELIYFQLDVSAIMGLHYVYVNDELILDTDFLEQFSEIGPVEQNSDGYYVIKVVNANNPSCFAEYEIAEAFCPTDCSLSDVNVEILCDESTGMFIPIVTFDFDSTYTDEVIINGNGINYGFYDPNQQPIYMDTLFSGSTTTWEFIVTDASDESCFAVADVGPIDCGGECSIANFTVETECDTTGLVYFYLDFVALNSSGEVGVVGNGTNYGFFDAFSTIELGPYDIDANEAWEFVVFDVTNDNCQAVYELGAVDCDDTTEEIPCLIEAIEVYDIDCIGDNEYSMSVDFEVPGGINVPFTFFLNGDLMNSTSSGSLPLNLFGLIPSDSTGVETITICLDGLADECCIDFTYETPECLFDAVDESLLEDVELSPNPTRDIINIYNIPVEIIGLNIIDNLGRSIEQKNASADMQFDVSNYVDGIYTVQFFTADNRVMNKRFVKMK